MIVVKITNGFVSQRYDTVAGRFLDQEFIGSDDREWENGMGDPVDPPSVNGEEPYLNMEMVQPKENDQPTPLIANPNSFQVGEQVLVTPLDNGDEPTQEFQGQVIGIKDNRYVQVRDQDDNVFDCEPVQVHHVM